MKNIVLKNLIFLSCFQSNPRSLYIIVRYRHFSTELIYISILIKNNLRTSALGLALFIVPARFPGVKRDAKTWCVSSYSSRNVERSVTGPRKNPTAKPRPTTRRGKSTLMRLGGTMCCIASVNAARWS